MYNCQTVPKNQGVTHVTETNLFFFFCRVFNQVQHCFIILGNRDEWTQEPLHTAPETNKMRINVKKIKISNSNQFNKLSKWHFLETQNWKKEEIFFVRGEKSTVCCTNKKVYNRSLLYICVSLVNSR